jgi:phosphoribosyl 1,2-cyclic phosphodiesterase
MVEVTFYGVRGSCPCPSEGTRRYGGNTACVALRAAGQAPVIFDLGTGLRAFAESQPLDGSFQGSALVSHIHWDHVQGLPFFPPADRIGARLDVYGPPPGGVGLGQAIDGLIRPPYFPVTLSELRGTYSFNEVYHDDLRIGEAEVMVRPVPHCGPTVGYRVTLFGRVVTYISDHQAPRDLASVDPGVLDLARDADLLIHDAQYTPEEFAEKPDWGHCTVQYALVVAQRSGARRLALFHHDPAHSDEHLDSIVEDLSKAAGPAGPEVIGAYEGLRIDL